MTRFPRVCCLSVLLACAGGSFVPAGAAARAEAAGTVQAIEAAEALKANEEFLGFKWGMGIALSADVQAGSRVKSASVVDGIVRVDERSDITPRIFLETHKFFAGRTVDAVGRSGSTLLSQDDTPIQVAAWGHGPFVGIQSSGENVIDAFTAGYMIGWRRKLDSDNSFNIGVGLVVDPKAQVLGDGLTANQPLPAGETEVRYKTEPRIGVTLVYSFAF